MKWILVTGMISYAGTLQEDLAHLAVQVELKTNILNVFTNLIKSTAKVNVEKIIIIRTLLTPAHLHDEDLGFLM